MNSKRALFFTISGLALLCLLAIGFAVYSQPTSTPALSANKKKISQSASTPPINYGLPLRLKIPKIDIDAPIVYVGLTKTGDMDVPTEATAVGWYKNGPLPGNKGSAVIAGHVTDLNGEPGVFTNLGKLQKGDKLVIVGNKNQMIPFTVRKTQKYSEDGQHNEVFNSNKGAHLNLITCAGDWDKTNHRFRQRLVVFADKTN